LTTLSKEKVAIITGDKDVTPLGDLDTIDFLKDKLLEENI
jgi:hypothetical protein